MKNFLPSCSLSPLQIRITYFPLAKAGSSLINARSNIDFTEWKGPCIGGAVLSGRGASIVDYKNR